MLRTILAGSRYLVIIAVLGTLVTSISVLAYGGITVVSIIIAMFPHAIFTVDGAKHVAIEGVEMIDLFLLGTILTIVSIGLYRLFIDDQVPLPYWLEITSLDDLKERLLGVIIVLLAVTFLGFVVSWVPGETSIVALGIAVGVVLFALAYLLSTGAITRKAAHTSEANDTTTDQAHRPEV
jgi:uncharacterized membrane protein YqhA